MTKEEYENEKAEIIRKFGKPEWDMSSPVNEAAKRLFDLKVSFINSKQIAKKAEQEKAQNEEWVENARNDDSVGVLSIDIPAAVEPFLLKFAPEEQIIIKCFFENPYQNSAEIGKRANVSRQKVAAFLESDQFIHFKGRVLLANKDHLPILAMAALQQSLKSKQSPTRQKALEMVLTEAGLFKDKDAQDEKKLEIVDPQAALVLRELGDKLAMGKKVRIVEE